MNNEALIKIAENALNRHETNDGRVHGDVASAVIGKNGKIYTGVCVDLPSWGLCAERSALAAMITDKQYDFQKIVAVWKSTKTGKLFVVPPCGHCRQFMAEISTANLEAEVLLGLNKSELLRNLLPFNDWPGQEVKYE